MPDFNSVLLFVVGFSLIAVASERLGERFARFRMPLITGYLMTGMLAGPYVLDLITSEAIVRLRFVDEMALGFIAFAAGGELYLRELKGRFGNIAWVTGGLVVVTFVFGSTAAYLLSGMIPGLADLSSAVRVAASLLAGAILVARSPSSAIAVVKELRAHGPFTKTVLGVTVIMDVVVIIAFAGAIAVAGALVSTEAFDFSFLALLVGELSASLAIGILLGHLVGWVVGRNLPWRLKSALLLAMGYGVFFLSHQVEHLSAQYLPWEFLIEPLFTCMVAGFIVTNRTRYRNDFAQLLHVTGPPVFVVFFTLTGASLALDVLAQTWLVALILFAVRLVAIFLGASGGMALSGAPSRHARIAGLAFITQAGVGLGLSKEVAAAFPGWGETLATVLIAVIVMNQIVGPPCFKWAIHRAKESHTRADLHHDEGTPRYAIIFGLEGHGQTLARQLRQHGWEVRIASRRATQRQAEVDASDLEIQAIRGLDMESLKELEADRARAVIGLLSDEDNLKVCEMLYEYFGTETMIVNLHERENLERFRELGVLVVDPGTALVSLMDHCVRSPAATSLMLGLDNEHDVVDITVRNPDLHKTPLRDLRLPLDVLVLYVQRAGRLMHSHGFTQLELHDHVTLVGSEESLDEVRLMFQA
jgi:Trk K+ transport system NAD-binding subunit/Kef-type K+ transport system membrane component KefB